jgi:hypothetical protein
LLQQYLIVSFNSLQRGINAPAVLRIYSDFTCIIEDKGGGRSKKEQQKFKTLKIVFISFLVLPSGFLPLASRRNRIRDESFTKYRDRSLHG